MAKFGMDLSKFHKVHSDKHSTTLRHISDKHEIKLAHGALSPSMKAQLEKIPMAKEGRKMYAYAGEVDRSPASEDDSALVGKSPGLNEPETQQEWAKTDYPSEQAQSKKGLPSMRSMVDEAQGNAPEVPSEKPDLAPAEPEQTTAPGAEQVTQPEAGALDFDRYLKEQTGALEQMEKAQEMEVGARQAYAKGVASKEAGFRKSSADDLDSFNNLIEPYQIENDNIDRELKENPINARQYIEKMGTGSKILNAIAMIVGGAGAGLTHGPNLAAQYLDDQIKQDIQSQIDNVGVKQSLFRHNLEKMGNMRDAYNMTRLQTINILQSELREAGAKAQGSAGAATIQLLQAKLQKDKSDLMRNAAIQKMQLSMTGGLELLPSETRERAVMMPDGSGYKLAISKKGAEAMREQIGSIQPIFSQLDRLQSLGPSALVPGSKANQTAQAIRAQLIPLVNENAGLKRLSGEDIHNIVQMFSDPTQFGQLMSSGARTEAFKTFLTDKLMSTMSNELSGGYRPRVQQPSQQAAQPVRGKDGRMYVRQGNYMVPVGK